LLPFTQPFSATNPDDHFFHINAIDVLLHQFVTNAGSVYEAAAIAGPYILGMVLRTQQAPTGIYGGIGNFPESAETLRPFHFEFPFMQIDDLFEIGRIIRPFCDQAHQMFGRTGSPCFDRDGKWMGK
jgi:hypothetical protein